MKVLSLPGLDAALQPWGRAAGPEGGPPASAVTIGAYDGVHLGHRDLIARTRAAAADLGAASVVVTFDRHPAAVVRPDSAPRLLTDLAQKLELLEGTGVDLTVLVHFDAERAAEDPEDFVRRVLVDALAVRAVVVGHDFHFGKARRGNVELLTAMGAVHGFAVTGVDLRRQEGAAVSSTRIRALVAAGEVGAAAELLGRPHQVRGVVGPGDRRGRLLGYPTANVAVPEEVAVPADGVYAAWYTGPDGVRRPACVSVGRRPTFYAAGEVLVEAHLPGWSGDLYGTPARVDFVAHQRGQQRFDDAAALIAQMQRDVEETRRLLGV